MENLIIEGKKYNKIYRVDKDTIIKLSQNIPHSWNYLKRKDLNFTDEVTKISIPKEDYKKKYPRIKCFVAMKYFNDYHKSSQVLNNSNMSDKEILYLLKTQMSLVKTIHKNNIIHGDITPSNILLNKNNDMKIIDFEEMIANNHISSSTKEEYEEDEETIKELLKSQDKINTLNAYMYYLCTGSMYETVESQYDTCFDKESAFKNKISNTLLKELTEYQREDKIVPNEYYFEDIISEIEAINKEKGLRRNPNCHIL